jgi:TonB family protein
MAEDQEAPTNTLTQATPEPAQEPVTTPAAEQQPAPTYEPVAAPAPQPNTDALYRVGAGVSAPVPLNSVEAEFTDEARRAKYQGVCIVSMIVDAQGNPQNPRVVRGLGMGLNERALEAVRRYRFKPAMLNGRTPVPVMISVEVNFRLY